MWKLILFLCFTAVHVLGEGQENVLPKTSEVPPVHATPQNNTGNSDVIEPLKETVSPEPISISVDADEKESGVDKPLVNQSSIQGSKMAASNSSDLIKKVVATVTNTNDGPNSTVPPVKPATIAPHGPGKWMVNEEDKICIIVQMSALFNIHHVDNQNKTHLKTFEVPVDNSTVASGNCGTTEQNLTLRWSSANVTNASMTLHFVKNVNQSDYSLHHFEVAFPASNFPDSTPNNTFVLAHEATSSKVGLSNSYRCLRQQKFDLIQNSTKSSGFVMISDLQFQAFKADNSTVFSLAKDCAFDTPDVVPIAVGCTLAVLVFIVLIAYLIGRRRSQGHGYLSM